MILNQISVFLENKAGKLSEFIRLLADNQIDLQALSIAESQDYGILRIIVDRPEKTAALLREREWPCSVTPVLAVLVPDSPGSLTNIFSVLADHGVSLAYSYAFLSRSAGQACVVLRVDDNASAEALLREAGAI
ncbi:MAG: acetolactate synthase [Clostridiales bacterium]|nr:acetolactate synthase [Clostridiales bacterium]